MERRTKKTNMNSATTKNAMATPRELDAFLRHLSEWVVAGGNTSARRSAFARAVANADAALQREYIRYGYPCAPDPRLDAYWNVQQGLAFAMNPRRRPEYVAREQDDAAYLAEVQRLIEVAGALLGERPRQNCRGARLSGVRK